MNWKFWQKQEPDSNLYRYAKNELQLAGLFDEDSDYNGMLGEAALEIVEVFAKQGHSGFSASVTTDIVNRLMQFKPLTPLTFAPDEWNLITYGNNAGDVTYQNRRKSTVFSDDNLHTWYDIDEPDRPRHPITANV